MLNLLQVTQVQLNINKVNYQKSNNITRSYQRGRRGDRKAIFNRQIGMF